ncbi:MAG: 4-alpha-glucanotransferase [Nocardioidaceae bacterium]|nr:4-alpha-glucanotransferase [Nocardioidaceae bacterium]
MHELTDAQRELARAYGVATEYDDWRGKPVVVPTGTVLAVLAALGLDAGDADKAVAALSAFRDRQRTQPLPPCVVTRQGVPVEVPLGGRGGAPAKAWFELEDDARVDAPVVGGAAPTVVVPGDLPLGYHTIHARWPDGTATSTLIVTPPFLDLPGAVATRRAWGLAAQLYSVRSRDSWGVGDLADLATLATWSGSALGADFVLVNPLSAAEPVPPMEPSPYLPSSRRFTNPLYLRVEDIPEYADLPPVDLAEAETLRAEVHHRLDALDAIDRDTVWAAKAAALRLVHAVPRTPERERAYRDYVRREADALHDFATWCALVEGYGADWHHWPAGLRHPDLPEVTAFRNGHGEAVERHRWLQWLLDEQLASAQTSARQAGMAVGVMHDLAVGVHHAGADAWTLQDTFAEGIHVGAPPDEFNQVGQDWSQPPWRPDRLVENAYTPYRELIRALLRHAGALRIDHIIGLFRLWWVPQGASPDQGTYVRYDHEALVGILALEAHRAGALVVGEDLGNVEPSARAYLAERGILGTSLLWFERDADGHPLPAQKWRECSLASVTTHDLPPTAGYLAGEHVELRDRLGLLTRPVEDERAADEADRAAWLNELRDEGVLADDAGTEDTVTALYRYLTRTPARLLAVALTDVVGDRRIQNQPGTTDEYPNWRVPLSGPDGRPVLLEEVMAARRPAELAAMLTSHLQPASAEPRTSP